MQNFQPINHTKMTGAEITKFIENFKTTFSGSSDYMSGINDAAYTLLRDILTNPAKFKGLVEMPILWIEVAKQLPKPEPLEVIGFSCEWIDADFNFSGTRSCFITEDGLWVSARWSNNADGYVEDKETKPTHWTPIPMPPLSYFLDIPIPLKDLK